MASRSWSEIAAPSGCETWHGARDGCVRPWRLIADWTGSTFVRPVRCGSDLTVERPAKSGRANGSALHAPPTDCCDSTCAAIDSSAVRGCSTDERTNLTGEGLGQRVFTGHPQITFTALRAKPHASSETGSAGTAIQGRISPLSSGAFGWRR